MREKTTTQPIEDMEWMPIHPAPPQLDRHPPTILKKRKIERRQIVLGLLFILPIPIFLTSLAMGSVSIPLGDVVTILLGGIPQWVRES